MKKNEQNLWDKKEIELPEFIKNIDMKKIGSNMGDTVVSLKNKAVQKFEQKKDNEEPLSERREISETNLSDDLDDETKKIRINEELQKAINEYNLAYTQFSDRGLSLFRQRERAVDLIMFIEQLINSIANRPKSFDADIEEIHTQRVDFAEVSAYAVKELEAAQKSAMGAGGGTAAGVAVVSLAPSVAMWVATTFGTASTGTAISSLSGAAATNAALAWLGGGALAAGGGGMAAGNAFLALAGPVGWGIAGVSLLTSIILFSRKKMKLKTEKIKEIEDIRHNTESISESDAKIKYIYDKTVYLREQLNVQFSSCMKNYKSDYLTLKDNEKALLGTLVNNTKSLAALLMISIE